MQRLSRYAWWSAAFALMILLAATFRQCGTDPMPSGRPIDVWSLVELADHLNRMGVNVRLQSTQANGTVGQTAFLTFTDKDWRSLNSLKKDSQRIHEWRGILFCERVGESDSAHLTEQWGNHSLAVGPFIFYGDAELLHRVRNALLPFASSAAS